MSEELNKKIIESMTPQMTHFEVIGHPRVYVTPRLGIVDLRLAFPEDKALICYKDINFPYLKLKDGAEELFKNEKVDTILNLINKATIISDIEILAKSKPESKKVQELFQTRIAELKKA
jgi:hypothetical protein